MLPEMLVMFACANNTGCTETSDQYFALHPESKQILLDEAYQIRKMVGPKVVDTVGPFLVFATGGHGTVNLGHHLSLQFSQSDATISFRLDI